MLPKSKTIELGQWAIRALILAFLLTISLPTTDTAQAAPIATWCVTGEFQNPVWDNNSIALFDDGTNGDLVNGDGIFSRDVTITNPSGNGAGTDFYEWKVVACENWGTSYPFGSNSFFRANIGDTVKFTLDTNSYGAGNYPQQNIHNVTGDIVPPTGFTAVGDWQGWNNSNPATALTDMGGGVYELLTTIPAAGSYLGKVSITGSAPNWHGYDANGRHFNTPDNITFTTTLPNQNVLFRLDLNTGRLQITPQSPPNYLCAAGAWQNPQWNNAADPMYDDGTHGDLTANDGIYSLDATISNPSGSGEGNDFYEWKVFTCGNWDPSYPPGNNSFFRANIGDTVTFTLDTNSYADGAYPAQNIHNVTGDIVPAVGFTAVGDWQGWNNSNPVTALTDMGGGIWEYTATVADTGPHLGKVSITGSAPNWHGYDANGRHFNTPDNINFSTSVADEQVLFQLDLNTGRLLVETQSPPAPTPPCLAGSFQGWNNASHPMFDDGTNGDLTNGDGIYSLDFTVAAAGNYEWKVVAECGDWGLAYPGENAWAITTTASQTVKFTLDTNTYGDGWYPMTNIVNATDSFGTSFTAVGDFNGDNSNDPLGLLSDLGGGIYEVEYTIPTAGNYIGRIALTGDGRSWGGDGRRAFNPYSIAFATSTPNEIVYFTLNTNTGRIRVVSSTAPPPVWDSIYHSACTSRLAANCLGNGDHASLEALPSGGANFSNATYNGAPVGDGVSDAYIYDDEPLTLYMLGDSGQLVDDGDDPNIRYWVGSEQFADMSYVTTWAGDWHGRTSSYDIFSGNIPAQPPMTVYYWLNAEHTDSGTVRSMCMSGGSTNAVDQHTGFGDCSFNDYAYAIVDDDTDGPSITNVVFSDGGDGLGNGNDQVCADVVETGTASGDNDSNVGIVNLLSSANLGDIIIGGGTSTPMNFVAGTTYCANNMSFGDPTYYRVDARNDDQDHPDGPNYTDIDQSLSPAVCEGVNCDFPTGDNNIQWGEVWHDTRDNYYRNPFGSIPSNSTVTIRLRGALDDLTFAFLRVYNGPNGDTVYNMTKVSSDASYDYYEATIPASDTASPRQLYYKFVLIDGSDEDWYIDDHDHNEYDHEDGTENGSGMMVDNGQDGQYYDNAFTLTVYEDSFDATIPEWAQNAVIYQIMPDRFRNGDPTNDTAWPADYDVYGADPYVHDIWNEAPVNPRDAGSPFFNFWSADFFGGDLQGIMDELDYLQSIGVTAIYLNPIFASPSNHGYDTTDYLTINPRYGDNALFAEFAAEAESRGIKIILDGVFNHTGSDSIYFDRYNRWDANGNPVTGNDGSGACEGAGSSFADFYNFDPTGTGPCYDGNDYESWFGYDSLPVLIDYLSGNLVRDFVFDYDNNGDNGFGGAPVVQYWYDLGADGWRFDVANEIPHDFWQEFRQQVKVNDGYLGPLYTEVWFEAQPWLYGDELDATMNYRYRKAVLGFLIDSTWTDNDNNGDQTMVQLSPSEFDYVLNSIREDYPTPAWYTMMNLMGSHDTNRALFVLREQSTDLPTAIAKLQMMAALQFTYVGSPTIYFGDEAGIGAVDYGGYGLWGAGYGDAGSQQDDPYNRHPYPWEPTVENDYNTWDGSGTFDFNSVTGTTPPTYTYTETLRETYSILGATRNSYPVLRTGDVITVLTDDANNTYAYIRVDANDCAIAIFNRSTTTRDVTLNGLPSQCNGSVEDVLNGGADWTVASGSVTVTGIAGLSSAVLVQPLGVNGLNLPPAAAITTTADVNLTASASTTISATFTDIVGQSLPAGVTVNFALVSGEGSLSTTTATTDSTGTASALYSAPPAESVAVIRASIVGQNGVVYSDSATVYAAFTQDVADQLTTETKIGPDFVDGFSVGIDTAVTKIGTGEPVISLGELNNNPYQGGEVVFSDFIDIHLHDATDVDMLAVQFGYIDETDEDNHEVYYWDGNGWTPVVAAAFLDTTLNQITFELTPTTEPSLAELQGTVFVVGDPGYYQDPGTGPGDGGSTGLAFSKSATLSAGSIGIVGDTIEWVVTLTNQTGSTLTDVAVTDTLPSGLQISSAQAGSGTVVVQGQTVLWTIPSLAAGESAQLRIVTTIVGNPAEGMFINTATLTTGTGLTASASASINVVTGLPDTGYPPRSE